MFDMNMNITDLLDLTSKISCLGILVLFIWGAFKPGDPWWVRGSHFKEIKSERDQYRDLAFRSTSVTDKAIKVMHTVIQTNKDPDA